MRRSPLVLTATIAGTAAVVAFNPSQDPGAPLVVNALPTSSSAKGTASGATPGSSSSTTTGRAVSMQFGTVQVQAILREDQLIEVRRLQMPDGDGQSAEISSYSGPLLDEQALAAQSAAVDGVSGATYTSDAYRESLQAALDQVRVSASSEQPA